MDALSGQRIQIRRQGRDQRFALAGLHLGDPSLVQNDAADDLDGKMLHPEHTPRSLAADGKRIGQDIVDRLAVVQALLQSICLGSQLLLRHGGILILQLEDPVAYRADTLQFTGGIVAEKRFE